MYKDIPTFDETYTAFGEQCRLAYQLFAPPISKTCSGMIKTRLKGLGMHYMLQVWLTSHDRQNKKRAKELREKANFRNDLRQYLRSENFYRLECIFVLLKI